MLQKLVYLTFLIVLLANIDNSYGQYVPDSVAITSSSNNVRVTTASGTVLRGKLIEQNMEYIILLVKGESIRVEQEDIFVLERIDTDSKFDFKHPLPVRYFYTPSAFGLQKGEMYYQNVMILFQSFTYGLSENISIGGGFEPISTLAGFPIWFLTPKASVKLSDNLHAGLSLIVAGVADEGASAIAYGVLTYGKPDSNLSVGSGIFASSGSNEGIFSAVISGAHRLSKSISIQSENFVAADRFEGTFYSGIHGIQILARKSKFDIGVFIDPYLLSDTGLAIPIIGYGRVF